MISIPSSWPGWLTINMQLVTHFVVLTKYQSWRKVMNPKNFSWHAIKLARLTVSFHFTLQARTTEHISHIVLKPCDLAFVPDHEPFKLWKRHQPEVKTIVNYWYYCIYLLFVLCTFGVPMLSFRCTEPHAPQHFLRNISRCRRKCFFICLIRVIVPLYRVPGRYISGTFLI